MVVLSPVFIGLVDYHKKDTVNPKMPKVSKRLQKMLIDFEVLQIFSQVG
jgi:hypothetical protein